MARKCCCKCHLIVCLCVRAQSPSLSRRSSQRCLRSWSWRRASGSTLKSSPTRCERVACVRACVRFVHMCGFIFSARRKTFCHTFTPIDTAGDRSCNRKGRRSVVADLRAAASNTRTLGRGRRGERTHTHTHTHTNTHAHTSAVRVQLMRWDRRRVLHSLFSHR